MSKFIRLRERIECPIGETVKTDFCKRCAYACDCKSYENYLNTRISKLREIYWRIRAWFTEWLQYIWFRIKEDVVETREKYKTYECPHGTLNSND
jgi:hypothetical protein